MNGNQLTSTSLPLWELVSLGEVVRQIDYGHTASAKDTAAGPRFLRITDIQDRGVDWSQVPGCNVSSDEIAKYRLAPGDLVFARTGATTGKSYLIRDCPAAIFASYLIRLRPEKGILPSFLSHFFQSPAYWLQVSQKKKGTGQPGINATILSTIQAPVPPEPQQSLIVEALDSYLTRLDAATEGLKRVEANLKRYRASVLKAAVEGRLVPTEAELAKREGRAYEPASELLARILKERRHRWEKAELAKMKAKGESPKNDTWKSKYQAPTAPDTTNLPALTEGWCWATLDQLAFVQGGIQKGKQRDGGERLREVPYLRVANVQRGWLDLEDVKTISASEDEIESLRLRPGDILFNEGGDRDKLGRGWIWQGEIGECIHQNHVFRARTASDEIRPKFVSWYGNGAGQRYFFDEGKQTTNLASLNSTKLRSLPVPLPPVAEQMSIEAELERLLSEDEAAERSTKTAIARLQRLRQSILTWAFEGKLVDQDPNDEPASALLERIRAGREVAENPAKRNRTARKTTR